MSERNLFALILLLFCLSAGTEASSQVPATTQKMQGRIVYSAERDDNLEICVMNPDGTGQSRLTNDIALDRRPSISPDGKQIVWESYRQGIDASIYVMNADGSNQRRLDAGLSPAFSPDGRQIVFITSNLNIALMNLDGSGVKILTRGKTGDAQPHFSPDGLHIVFSSGRDYGMNADEQSEIYVMDVDGGHVKRLTNSSGKERAIKGNPVFSPDGHSIAFDTQIVHQGYGFSTGFISLMDKDGGSGRQLTSDDWFCNHPSFSSNGRRLAVEAVFKTTTGDNKAGIYVMNADGSNFSRIEAGNSIDQQDPSWGAGDPISKDFVPSVPAPTPLPTLSLSAVPRDPALPVAILSPEFRSSRLAHLWFTPHPDPGVYRVSGKIYVVLYENAKAGSPLIYQIKNVDSYSGGSGTRPTFSPDGRYVLLHFSQKGINYSLQSFYIWDTTILRLQPALPYLLDGYFQSWSPDGNYLLFVSYKKGASTPSEFLVVDRRTGREHRIPRQVSSGFEASWLAPHQLLYTQVVKADANDLSTHPRAIGAEHTSLRPDLFLFSPETGKSQPFLQNAHRPIASPNGQWVAFFGPEHPDKPFSLNVEWQDEAKYSALSVVRSDGKTRKALDVQDQGSYEAVLWSDNDHLLVIRPSQSDADSHPFAVKEFDITTGRSHSVLSLDKVDWQRLNTSGFYNWRLSSNGESLILYSEQQKLQSLSLKTGTLNTIVQFSQEVDFDWWATPSDFNQK